MAAGEDKGGDGGGQGVALLVHDDLAVPLVPDLGGDEHAVAARRSGYRLRGSAES